MTSASFAKWAEIPSDRFHNSTHHAPYSGPLHADDWVRGRSGFGKAAQRQQRQTAIGLRRDFTRHGQGKAANDKQSGKSGSGDSMLGSILLEGLFFAAFPGLTLAFNGFSLTPMDAVDTYDTLREAFGRPANDTRVVPPGPTWRSARQFVPLAPRRRWSLLSLLLG